MTAAEIIVESIDGRLEIALNRPAKRNALHPELLAELAHAITDPGDAHVVVLRSKLEAGFSAGFDLDVLRELGTAAHEGDPIGTTVNALLNCPVPTVAVLNGFCIGASVELIAACDLRVARSDVRLAVPANRLGAPYRPSGVDLLARRFGWATAVELLVFGTTFDADAAAARRLVSFVGDDAALTEHLDALFRRVADAPAAAATHRRMLAEWAAPTATDTDLLSRWKRVREAAVATRRIPPSPNRDDRSASHA